MESSNKTESYFSMGQNTFRVPMSLHKKNRNRLVNRFSKLQSKSDDKIKSHVILLQGAVQATRDATDHEPLLRQESYFHWAFGATESGLYGAIHVQTGRSTLFIPKLPKEYIVWMGELKSKQEFMEKYDVDQVLYVEELNNFLKGNATSGILLLQGINTDSGNLCKPASFEGLEEWKQNNLVNYNLLHPEITECRVIKTPEEIELLEYVAKISSEAHVKVMQTIKPGMQEYQLESTFLNYCYFHGGARFVSYTCICATGENSAVLHYGHSGAPNSRHLQDGDICMFDMGCEYHCYGSDITCSFPANGEFDETQRIIYSAVLDALKQVESSLRPGVNYRSMHVLAERVILTHLSLAGFLVGDIDDMVQARLGALFMPHGLGHLLGLDTHDVGGYMEGTPQRSTEPGLKSLRTARNVEAGMYLTVEPGCYFISAILEDAIEDETLGKFLVADKIREMYSFGGIRLEDDVLITEDGIRNFTLVPREIEDVEKVMAGATWQPLEVHSK